MTLQRLFARHAGLAAVAALLLATFAPTVRAHDAGDHPEGFYFAPEVVFLQFRDSEFTFDDDDEIDTDYEIGWRLGLGYRWNNGFDLIFRGTGVDTDDSTFDFDDEDEEALISVEYFVLDGEVGHTFGDPDSHRFRFFGGVRYADIDQERTVFFSGADSDPDFTDIEFSGIGLRLGGEGHLAFGSGWSVFIGGSGSVMAGDFDTFEEFFGSIAESGDDFDRTITVLEIMAGFAWHHTTDGDMGIGVRFGYEMAEWSDVPTFESPEGDFSADGGFVRVEFTF